MGNLFFVFDARLWNDCENYCVLGALAGRVARRSSLIAAIRRVSVRLPVVRVHLQNKGADCRGD